MGETIYCVNLTGSGSFRPVLADLQKLARRRDADGALASFDSQSRTWTVRVADGDFQAAGVISFARSRAAQVIELNATPDPAALRAERKRLLARVGEIDAILANDS